MKNKIVLTGVVMSLATMLGIACSRVESAKVSPKDFPAPTTNLVVAPDAGPQSLVLAGGCFWCTEGVFEQMPGVSNVVSGYAGDAKDKAVYEIVGAGISNHAEVIRITYDPTKTSFGELLKVFFAIAHDPTQLNRQGPDVGRQYRSAIFYETDDQKRVAEAYIAQLNEAKVFEKPIVTTLEKLDGFYEAEGYHQDYAKRNPDNPYLQQTGEPKFRKAAEYAASTQPTTKP
jgi:peptide-methionine (S)-S-oxide reductase